MHDPYDKGIDRCMHLLAGPIGVALSGKKHVKIHIFDISWSDFDQNLVCMTLRTRVEIVSN